MLSDAVAQELNQRTALSLGWRLSSSVEELDPEDTPEYFVPNPDYRPGKTSRGEVVFLPDFVRDSHALGWLVAWLEGRRCFYEVIRSGAHCRVLVWGVEGRLLPAHGGQRIHSEGNTLSEALCRAVLEVAQHLAKEKEKPHAE